MAQLEQPRMVTPEAVALEFTTANVGSRILAFVIDAAIVTVVSFLGILPLALTDATLPDWLVASILVILIPGWYFGYFTVSETLWRGRTVGKAALGLRVVTKEGGPVRFDVPAGLEPFTATLDVSGLTIEQYQAVRTFLLRTPSLAPQPRASLALQLASPLAERLRPPPPAGVPPELYLRCVAAAYQRRQRPAGSELASRAAAPASAWGAVPQEPHAPSAAPSGWSPQGAPTSPSTGPAAQRDAPETGWRRDPVGTEAGWGGGMRRDGEGVSGVPAGGGREGGGGLAPPGWGRRGGVGGAPVGSRHGRDRVHHDSPVERAAGRAGALGRGPGRPAAGGDGRTGSRPAAPLAVRGGPGPGPGAPRRGVRQGARRSRAHRARGGAGADPRQAVAGAADRGGGLQPQAEPEGAPLGSRWPRPRPRPRTSAWPRMRWATAACGGPAGTARPPRCATTSASPTRSRSWRGSTSGPSRKARGHRRDPTPIPPPSARSWTTNSLGPSPGPPAAGEQRAPPAAGSGCGVDQVPSVQEWR